MGLSKAAGVGSVDSLTGTLAGEYRLLAKIGQGGMSVVYRAERPGFESAFAIKILSPAAVETGHFARRFLREASVLTRLRHRHIVPVVDIGEVDGRPFLVMPLVEGGSLGDRLHQGPLNPLEGGRILGEIAIGLQYAHDQGVVHRDIKPSNVLLDATGEARLSDFGLVLIQDASLSLTGSALIGTPSYMSPEQARGAPVDARADQYSLGIVLYEMTTGRLPFVADTPMAVVVKHIQEQLPLPRDVNPNVPLAVERVILKSTAKDPEDRFPTVQAMNAAFQEALAYALRPSGAAPQLIPVPASARSTLPLPRPVVKEPSAWSRRRKVLAASLGVLALLLCVAGGAAAFRLLGSGGGFLSIPPADPQLADSAPGMQATIDALSTALALQETAGPEEAALLASLQGTLTALPARIGGSKNPSTGSQTPTVLSSATQAALIVLAGDGSGTPRAPSATVRAPTRTPTRTPGASATKTKTPSATASGGSPSPTTAGATAMPTPTRTATVVVPSSTSAPTSTSAPPTATLPAPTATQPPPTLPPPTPTETSEPPPPEDLCENAELKNLDTDFTTMTIDLENRNGQQIEITTLWIDWPWGRDRLERLRLKGSTIWDQGDSHPPTSMDPDEWRSGRSRTIDGGTTEALTFSFDSGSMSQDYELHVTLNDSCQIHW